MLCLLLYTLCFEVCEVKLHPLKQLTIPHWPQLTTDIKTAALSIRIWYVVLLYHWKSWSPFCLLLMCQINTNLKLQSKRFKANQKGNNTRKQYNWDFQQLYVCLLTDGYNLTTYAAQKKIYDRTLFIHSGTDRGETVKVDISKHWFVAKRDYVTFGNILWQIRLSVCLSVVCDVRAPYSGV